MLRTQQHHCLLKDCLLIPREISRVLNIILLKNAQGFGLFVFKYGSNQIKDTEID